jgi:hypothetical protein
METKLFLFISSTSDLKEERRALAEDLRRLYEPFLYEEYGAGGTPPENVLREKLERSDVFIGLLGPRYGSPYKPPDDMRSIVEWEFDMARSRGNLEVMPFRKSVSKDQIEPSQLEFINRLSTFGTGGMWCKEFDSPPTLVKLVRESLEGWIIRQHLQIKSRSASWLNRMLAPMAIGLVLLCVVVSLLFVAQVVPFSQSSVFGFCALVFFTILLGVVVLMSQIGGRNVRA